MAFSEVSAVKIAGIVLACFFGFIFIIGIVFIRFLWRDKIVSGKMVKFYYQTVWYISIEFSIKKGVRMKELTPF